MMCSFENLFVHAERQRQITRNHEKSLMTQAQSPAPARFQVDAAPFTAAVAAMTTSRDRDAAEVDSAP
jgi:hypothetical protein